MSLDLNAQILQALTGGTSSAKKQSDFVNYNLYSKKNDQFLGTCGLLPHTKDAMLTVLENIFKVEEAGSRTAERPTISTEDII